MYSYPSSLQETIGAAEVFFQRLSTDKGCPLIRPPFAPALEAHCCAGKLLLFMTTLRLPRRACFWLARLVVWAWERTVCLNLCLWNRRFRRSPVKFGTS